MNIYRLSPVWRVMDGSGNKFDTIIWVIGTIAFLIVTGSLYLVIRS
jgi:hypothetical protein